MPRSSSFQCYLIEIVLICCHDMLELEHCDFQSVRLLLTNIYQTAPNYSMRLPIKRFVHGVTVGIAILSMRPIEGPGMPLEPISLYKASINHR